MLQEGIVTAGDPAERIKIDLQEMTVERVYRAMYFDNDAVAAAKVLRIEALSPDWREMFEEKLRKLDPASGGR